MKEYNKLVRDRVIEIIEAKGQTAEHHIATETEFKTKAIEKLQEELAEFLESENPEELADLLEITYAVGESLGISKDALEAIRIKKSTDRGGFSQKIILEKS